MSERAGGLALLALTLAGSLACSTVRPEGPRSFAPGGDAPSTPLERGLASVSAERIRADVEFLAADELEGRDTPSRGLRVAADFIENRLASLGLEPGGPRGWEHGWILAERQLTPERVEARLTLGDEVRELALGLELGIHPSDLRDGSLAGELVWCGSGEREDFEGLDLSGAIAVSSEGEASRARLRRRAEEVGAAGLLVLARPASSPVAETGEGPADGGNEPGAGGEPEEDGGDERLAEWAARLARVSHHWPQPPGERLSVYWLGGAARDELLARAAGLRSGEPLEGRFEASVAASVDREVANVCALWRGRDPALAREVILVSAHYDHIGVRGDEVFNGADDNASGVAALLALAEALAAHGPLERSVLLLFVSGEEQGLHGSRAWAEAAPFPPALADARAICNVNFDMVGRNAPGLLEYTPTPEHEAHNRLAQRVAELAALEGFDDLRSADKDFSRSDHASFARALEIPVLYVSAGEHDDYHQPTDTAEKVDCDKVARFTRLVLRLLAELQAPELELEAARQASGG